MAIQKLIQNTKEHAIEYGSLPFWSWNDKLEDGELRRQIGVMHDLGMNGFFMHARGGLETEYLSDDWFHAVDTCVDEAKKYKMEAWSYDENGWPSGFAGGKLLEDPKNHATFLKYETSDVFPSGDHILAIYTLEGTTLTRVTAPADGVSVYHVIRQGWDASFVDTLDLSITKKFLAATHDEYLHRMAKEDFGTAMPGFFTDEPQYYRWATVWSDTLPTEFYQAYGYSIFDKLAALFINFDGDKEFRYDFWKLCHHLFINHWIRPVYEWCDAHGCRLTGHVVEETQLFTQMWCCGGVMPCYEYEHIPGMDYLGRGLTDDVAPKQLGSVCAQLGKKKVLSEMFACCGWDVTPKELKRIAELQYAGGVNMMCQHLYAYSIRGQRKRDYPANYSEHLPWQPQMKAFNTYFNNLGYLLSRGEEVVNTLVIHPIHAAYLTYQRDADYHSIETLENNFHALSNLLSKDQIPYHWGDETMMVRLASVEGKKLRVGKCVYDYVILPAFETIDENTVKLLKEFYANGGKVWCYGEKPTRIDGRIADLSFIQDTTTYAEIAAAADVTLHAAHKGAFRQMVRDTEDGKIVYLVNLGDDTEDSAEIAVSGVTGMTEIKLDTLETVPVCGTVQDGRFVFTAAFEGTQSRLFIQSEEQTGSCTTKTAQQAIPLDPPFSFAEQPENLLTIDHYAVSFDGGKTYTEQRPLERIRDNLLRDRYKGTITLKAVFTVDEHLTDLILCAEPLAGAVYTINGTSLDVTGDFWLDRSFRTADILPFIKIGENEITVTFDYFQRDEVYYVLYGGVSESLRNCLVFDTEIECLYLKGHFALRTPGSFQDDVRNSCIYTGGFSLIRQEDKPIAVHNLVTEGYPFFAGTVKLKTVYNYTRSGATELFVRGRYATCEVFVNGARAAMLMFTDHCNLSAFLKEGENEIILALTNSNRNLLGPHHGHDPEPFGVGPGTFSMENQWNGAECGAYLDRYAFVRFGFDA